MDENSSQRQAPPGSGKAVPRGRQESQRGIRTRTASSAITENTQVRENPYPGQATITTLNSNKWTTFPANASQISYKGRWDDQHISWWSAPGLVVGFTGEDLAVSFGNWTDEEVLLAYRVDGQDWQFSNVTANASYQFINAATTGLNLTNSTNTKRFEFRVTNWSYGVQIQSISVSSGQKLVSIPTRPKTVEIIGDSLSAGQYATYEAISSWSWGFAEGLGDAEYSITAYPGICLVDANCWGNPHGQTFQWYRTSDTSGRAIDLYGDNPPHWNFATHPAADLTVINIGTNDNNTHNNVSAPAFQQSYIDLINGIHQVWPQTQIIIFSLWSGFSAVGSTYVQGAGFLTEIENVYNHFADQGFVHYFNTTGILQHNDIGPLYHPTDVGHIKVASHLLQYVRLQFDWDLLATGPEVQSDTLYWNDQSSY
ncbi:hypothetical protein LTR47_001585 [Exophiala xenobiotica]|nr:hypothetical protein LTR41_003476 [Exophiala xenobiotica]KAK5224807.1 hypothetical protein LTR72_004588 [Exophiala xenobiotica]KAK5237319.1 hypothetical protein LTR47_001585 [Exophiala xenobiotica]KAK5248443.1 hypothetical protein LTS06_006516 [Exophiala xenobiotica]KAK5293889.1 hypothetical protein LTR14_004780 [Exophiala xenobiotica]